MNPTPPRPGFSEAFESFAAALSAGLSRKDAPAAFEVGLHPDDIEVHYTQDGCLVGVFPDPSESASIAVAHVELLRSLDPLCPVPVVFNREISETSAPNFQSLSSRLLLALIAAVDADGIPTPWSSDGIPVSFILHRGAAMEFDTQGILTSEFLLDAGSAIFVAAAQAAATEAFESSPEWFQHVSGRAGFRLPSPDGPSAHELLEARMSIRSIPAGGGMTFGEEGSP